MKKTLYTLAVLLACALSSIAASAQDALSLSDAIQMGLQRNYDIQIQQKSVQIASNNNSWGEAGRYPTISLNLNQAMTMKIFSPVAVGNYLALEMPNYQRRRC